MASLNLTFHHTPVYFLCFSPPALNPSSVNEELHLKAMVAQTPRSLGLPPSPSLCSLHLCTGLVPQSDAVGETKAMTETEGKASSSVKGT